MINWNVSKKEMNLIREIAKRALILDPEYNMTDAQMDITACHANGTPLDLAELLKADDFNFSHDIFGIRRHISRDTGKITRGFLPRYSAPSKTK